MNERWLKNVNIEDITTEDMVGGDMKLVAELCGIDVAVKLLECMTGLSIYISDKALNSIKAKYIRSQYDGTRDSVNRLAIECGVSTNYIYKVTKPVVEAEESKRQLNLFGS